ncbi:MAG: surface lipoprotein [Alteromonas sp.]|uniref:MlaA family lipoprotein n=1 Tax=Alteromonas naphthalenivorans TaxID=715451 RepID=UPI000A053D45|nr:VacJ family lipoprotein [Alteromonas naphthalenivorans]PHS50925.1 MAG: surface lipoprotein [Alteromonas sp.]
MKFSKWVSVSALLLASLLGGCASQQVSQQVEQNNTSVQDAGDPRDPLEPVNRVMWDFNWEVLDAYVLRPITVGYVTVMPQFARTGLLNAAENLQEPANFMNNMFQGKVDDGMDSLARFVLNSTVGLFGTIDVASHIGIVEKEEEFGETMGVWGVNTGPYLMLPALGPNDPRSFTGSVVDGMVYPMAIIDGQFAIARYLVSLLEGRASLIDQEQQLEQSVDDYAFVKNAYFENLAFKVTDGKSGDKALEEDQLDDFAEFEAMLEYEETDVEADDSKEEPEEDGPEGN